VFSCEQLGRKEISETEGKHLFRMSEFVRQIPGMKILITGVAGFIGFHLAKSLLERGEQIVGIDNLNDYYDVRLKQARLAQLAGNPAFAFHQINLADRSAMSRLFSSFRFRRVINLAAQAGVRYSLVNPHAYADSNLLGFMNVLEGCRNQRVEHLVYASSSSVYGANTKMPFSVHHPVDHPLSLYAATKKANELMAHAYSHTFSLPTTGLRFFTVYGPWGRPDMAMFLFTKAILEDRPIDVFNHGNMRRDFTYIDDIVEGIVRVTEKIPEPNREWDHQSPDPGSSRAPYRVYNIGNHNPVELLHLIHLLEENLGKTAQMRFQPLQIGDVSATYADVEDLVRDFDFRPATSIEVGVERFVAWYREYSTSCLATLTHILRSC
jgi:UDP-glucuronate 4-epimerase